MNVDQFYELTGYRFEQQALLLQALTHRSFSRSGNNERLEFLGDSVVSLIITKHIYRRFPDAAEGEMSRMRAALVKQSSLALVAKSIGLGDHIRLGGGELKSGGFRRASILSDALEAIIGAIYLDSGFDATERVVLELFRVRLETIDSIADFKDPKTRLQEYLQSKQQELPVYSVEQTSGKAHSQIFTVSCRIAGLDLAESGTGSSRKKAEQQAASKLLARLDA